MSSGSKDTPIMATGHGGSKYQPDADGKVSKQPAFWRVVLIVLAVVAFFSMIVMTAVLQSHPFVNGHVDPAIVGNAQLAQAFMAVTGLVCGIGLFSTCVGWSKRSHLAGVLWVIADLVLIVLAVVFWIKLGPLTLTWNTHP